VSTTHITNSSIRHRNGCCRLFPTGRRSETVFLNGEAVWYSRARRVPVIVRWNAMKHTDVLSLCHTNCGHGSRGPQQTEARKPSPRCGVAQKGNSRTCSARKFSQLHGLHIYSHSTITVSFQDTSDLHCNKKLAKYSRRRACRPGCLWQLHSI
jgi:hypothetical protein